MIKGKVKKFFDVLGGNSGLIEEFIYNNKPNKTEDEVKVYTGATNLKMLKSIDKDAILPNGKNIKFYSGEGIRIVRKGKAGSLKYINDNNYTINDDAYILKVKEKYKDMINLKYFACAQKQLFKDCVSSEGEGKNGTFNKTLFQEMYFEIPEIEKQKVIVKEYERCMELKEKICNIEESINEILKKVPKCEKGDLYSVKDVFNMYSEDRRLTEEYIYNNQGQYPVYSAQKEGAYGYVNSYRYDEEILFVVQYGDSGKTILRKGKMNVGRNVCGLVPNDEFKEKISLRFAKYILQAEFINNSKGKDLKSLSQETINSTMFFLPDYNEQIKIEEEYEKLEKLKEELNKIKEKISN
ncbi:MAG: hypothetical protein HFJ43_02195, partial [Clostridia bacterium]|nr:hypothetical protein [Clostridia bacterium]